MSILSLTLSLLVAGSSVSDQAISSSQGDSHSLSRQNRDTEKSRRSKKQQQRKQSKKVRARGSGRRSGRTKKSRDGSSGIRTQYSLEEQKATRDKVFQKKMQEIISHYSEDGMIWTSPDRELDSFEVANQSIDLKIETKFTEEEKQQVRNGIKEYWCGVSSSNSHGSPIYTRLWKAIDPRRNLFSGRIGYYIWWRNYCDGKESRHPNWYDRSWPSWPKS